MFQLVLAEILAKMPSAVRTRFMQGMGSQLWNEGTIRILQVEFGP